MKHLGLPIRVLYFVAVVTFMPFFQGAAADTQSVQYNLLVNQPIERELTGKQNHDYPIWLESGQFARVTVDQRGVDLMVWLISPTGEEIEVIDSPNDSFGIETVFISAIESGNYIVKVGTQRPIARIGKYEIKLQELRAANNGDIVRIKAQHLCSEATLLYLEGVAQSKRQALEKFLEALRHWNTANEQTLASRATSYIGMIYLDLGEVNRAVEYFETALSYSREKGFRRDEMQALLNLAEACQLMGDLRLALQYHDQGLKIIGELGDFQKEALTLSTIGSINVSLGEPDLAIKSFLRSAEISNTRGLHRIEGMTLSKMGAVYLSIGEYQDALNSF